MGVEINDKDYNNIDAAIKKFKKATEGTIKDVKNKMYYKKPSVRKREKREAAKRLKLRYGI